MKKRLYNLLCSMIFWIVPALLCMSGCITVIDNSKPPASQVQTDTVVKDKNMTTYMDDNGQVQVLYVVCMSTPDGPNCLRVTSELYQSATIGQPVTQAWLDAAKAL